MGIQQVRFRDFSKVVELYRSKTIDHLRHIRPKWTFPKDAASMLNNALKPEENEYSIFLVNANELVRKSELMGLDTTVLFNGDSLNDGRVAVILYRWENNMFVDPPIVEVSSLRKNRLCFCDGRHRTKTALLLGSVEIPIAICNENINNIKRLIKLMPV